MCENCSTDPKYKSQPNTPERKRELDERTNELILKYGHQITGVLPDGDNAAFFYTVGRSVFERPELLLTGNLDQRMAMHILNDLAGADDRGEVDLLALATGEPMEIEGFGCALKFVMVNPLECEMFGATNISGPNIDAIQVIWPDAAGHWPDEPEYEYGPDAQPVHALQ